MTHEELNAIVDGMWKPIREQLQAANQRIAELEARIAAMPAPIQPAPIDVEAIAERAAALIKPPKDGQDAPPVDVDSIVLRVAELIPPPKDGAPGVDGRDGTCVGMDAVEPVLRQMLTEEIARIPKPENGKDGQPGESIQGPPGKDAPPVDTTAIIQEVVRQIPTPKDGRDADPVDHERVIAAVLERMPKPKDGEAGAPGKDAALPDIAGMIDSGIKLRFADWAVDQERQAQEVFRRAIEAMPKPQDGKHGLGFEDMDILDDGAGTVTLMFKRGELEKSRTIRFPWQEHMGVWKEGNTYRYGNDVTWAGSVWRCLVESTIQKPGNGSSDWRLIVKRGEDGRNGKDGKDGERGPQGERGRDLTQLSPDGRKY